jgi:DNA-directed RNA polymerase specialized sigma subunit
MEFDASQRDDIVELLARCIAELPPTEKTLLALYYHEDLEVTEIATCLGLTDCEIDRIRTESVRLLQSMLAAQIDLPELPAGLDKPEADGAGLVVNC